MFIVYSPEGRSFIGAAQNLPVLKVDPATRINPTHETDLENMSLEPDHSNPHFQSDQALKKYQNVKHANERKLVVKAFEIMTTPVFTIEPNASLHKAWKIMQQHDIHHLPVILNNSLVGMFTKTDLLNRVILNDQNDIEEARAEKVEEIMSSQVVATQPDTDIREVALALTEYDIGALPIVTSNEALLGIITLSDLVKRLSQTPPIELYI
ncbi:MAG: CBS domain-containing protein [Pseudomonadota bacterium]|nr:CBS domain-containing protein [Pseudomonadota bacterium]